MTVPGPDLVRAVRAACMETFPDCAFPSESCNRYCAEDLRSLRAALAELENPSAEMLDAAEGVRTSVNSLVNSEETWRAIVRKVLGET